MKLVGAAYLLYLSYRPFLQRRDGEARRTPPRATPWLGLTAFWATVVRVEFTDIVFAIDSILVAVAMSPKLWVILTGGILGIVTMRLVIGKLLALVERYPPLVDGAFVIIAWVGVKLLIEFLHTEHYIAFEIPRWLSLGVIVDAVPRRSWLYARAQERRAAVQPPWTAPRTVSARRGFRVKLPRPRHCWDWVALVLVALLLAAGATSVWWLSHYAVAVHKLTLRQGDTMFYDADGRPWFRLDEQRHDVPLDEIARSISNTPSSRLKTGVSTIIPASIRLASCAPSSATCRPAGAPKAAARCLSSSRARFFCPTSGRSAARRRRPGSRFSSSNS